MKSGSGEKTSVHVCVSGGLRQERQKRDVRGCEEREKKRQKIYDVQESNAWQKKLTAIYNVIYSDSGDVR